MSAYIDHLYPFILISTRMTALMMLVPVYSGGIITSQVKLAFIVMLSLLMHFGFGIGQGVTGTVSLTMFLEILSEFAIGAGMGLVMQVIFSAIGFAAAIIAPQMGMAISQLLDPQSESMQPLLSTFLTMMAVMLFLAYDGHLMVLQALFDSYRLVPIGGFMFTESFMQGLIDAGSMMFSIAFRLSLPILAVIIFLNIGMAIMARAVPQVNVIVVGFIITISVGIFSLSMFLPIMGPFIREFVTGAFERMLLLLAAV